MSKRTGNKTRRRPRPSPIDTRGRTTLIFAILAAVFFMLAAALMANEVIGKEALLDQCHETPKCDVGRMQYEFDHNDVNRWAFAAVLFSVLCLMIAVWQVAK